MHQTPLDAAQSGFARGAKSSTDKVDNRDHDGTADNMSIEKIERLLSADKKVRVAGIDMDGVFRGKIMAKERFLEGIKGGFGFSSAIFGWDMHDVLYPEETTLTSAASGYSDLVAEIDLDSMRRLPCEDNIAMFLLRFKTNGQSVCVDGRGVLASLTAELAEAGIKALAGVELEFWNFQTPTEDGYNNPDSSRRDLAAYLETHSTNQLRPLTRGMFCYSSSRPLHSKRYFHDIFDSSLKMGIPIEGWHTESGPGVYEAALAVTEVSRMADNVALFKFLTKAIGVEHGITPCFMAKPSAGLPGNSGHMHISLTDLHGKNLFARSTKDREALWPDITHLSDIGRSFLAGIIEALPDIMPLLAPNINSYKRLVENYWAPVSVGWGLEDRLASLRLIAPPVSSPGATRFEVRIPGADLHPHFALAAVLKAGWHGVKKNLPLNLAPSAQMKRADLERLPYTLDRAVERFAAKGSLARELFGDDFVDTFTISRQHEVRVAREAVTEWEIRRYIETA